ncbi:MAG: hypothetical protein J0M24_00185 [Verrucomicrobia bacterium]|nr:hypothetical protein [Verrucomicrobiota bacterium]
MAPVSAVASTVAVQALRAIDNLPAAEARVTWFTPELLHRATFLRRRRPAQQTHLNQCARIVPPRPSQRLNPSP